MNGATLFVEIHGWRRPRIRGGYFGRVLVLGFASVCWCPFLLSDWFETRALKLKNVLKGPRFPEMAVHGEEK